MNSPRLRRLRRLILRPDAALLSALLGGPLAAHLRELAVAEWTGPRRTFLGWGAVARAVAGRTLPALESLTLAAGLLVDRALPSFLSALRMPALSRLLFDGAPAAEHLEALPPSLLAKVREAAFAGAGPGAFRVLAHLPRIESLSLDKCGLSAADVGLLASTPPLPLLWSLDVSNNRLGDAGARALSAVPLLREARALRASYCGIGPAGAASLCRALPAGLATLDLSWNAIRDDALAHLAAGVEALDASYCEIEDGVAAVVGAWPAGKLHSLNLGTNRLTDRGVAALLASPAAEGLEALDLSNNRLTDATAGLLLDSPLVHRLSLLVLFGNEISPDAMGRLRARFRGIVT